MKHMALWTFLLWAVILYIFELPLSWFSIGETIGTSNIAYIVIVDIYSMGSLFALVIAKYVVNTIDPLIANKTVRKESEVK